MSDVSADLGKLQGLLLGMDSLAVAVSGGVDSMTLAVVAHRMSPSTTRMFHAVSPAVPAAATERVQALASDEAWNLTVIDAGELDDDDYRANPADRCYFCKRGLYGGILRALQTSCESQVLAGTNLDDLGDFRPGLRAAEEQGVRHPFVEAQMTKLQVRAIAQRLGFRELSELPAAPCLASRFQTGLAIDAEQLLAIDRVELGLRKALLALEQRPQAVRCRVQPLRVELAIDADCLDALDAALRARLLINAQKAWGEGAPPMSWTPYQMGQTFEPSAGTRAFYETTTERITQGLTR